MSLATPADLYPLATDEGTQIRHDIARPHVCSIVDISGTEVSHGITGETQLLSIYTSVDTVVAFMEGSGTEDIAGIIIAAQERATFHLPADVTQLYLRAINNTGVCYIQELLSWHGLATKGQLQFM